MRERASMLGSSTQPCTHTHSDVREPLKCRDVLDLPAIAGAIGRNVERLAPFPGDVEIFRRVEVAGRQVVVLGLRLPLGQHADDAERQCRSSEWCVRRCRCRRTASGSCSCDSTMTGSGAVSAESLQPLPYWNGTSNIGKNAPVVTRVVAGAGLSGPLTPSPEMMP